MEENKPNLRITILIPMENLIQFLGRLHPLIVHLPIGFLLMTLAIQGVAWKRPAIGGHGLLPWLWLASCVSAVLACVAGYLLSLSGDYAERALNPHMYAGIALALFSGFVFYVLLRKPVGQPLLRPVSGLVLLLLIATGHLGGNLTHGEDYLTQPLTALLGKAPATPVKRTITNSNEAVVYADLIEPILEKKCWQCHSAEKQKGGLRLDTPDLLLKGGKHGPVLLAGDVTRSDLYQRLLLPEDNDKRMPPKGKPQLTEAEIEVINLWISAGHADFKKRVADLPRNEKVKTWLAQYVSEPTGQAESSETELPVVKPGKVNVTAKQKAERQGIVVTPLTPDQSLLAVDLVNVPDFGDAQMVLLLPLKEHIVWLDLSATQITDQSLGQIAQFKNLTRLSLDNTHISDAGLAQLKNLPVLQRLNLYATSVTDRGLTYLKSCKNLKAVYLWQTNVTPSGVAALQKALGEGTDINSGMNTNHAPAYENPAYTN